MTTFGVYTKDLTGVSISNLDLETAKGYCLKRIATALEKQEGVSN